MVPFFQGGHFLHLYQIQGDFQLLILLPVLIKVVFNEAQRMSFWIHEIQRYTISFIWQDETKNSIKHE